MSDATDHDLLAEFARGGSETTFAALVGRHVNLVYSTALRFTGNAHHAEEITQAVFIVLARKAGGISARVVLSGWLYQTARLTAANFMKGEIRRQRREQEAYMQSTLNEPDAAWQQIAPHLDEAMGTLGEADRAAVVLRYFEQKTAAEVAAALRTTEAAAHKRVQRALEKLRHCLGKRGVTLGATFLAAALAGNSVQAAPVGLTVKVSALAVSGAAGTPTLAMHVKAALKILAWQKARSAALITAALLLAVGSFTFAYEQLAAADPVVYDPHDAQIPYLVLDDGNQFADGFDQTKLVAHFIVGSHQPGVDSKDLHLTIRSRTQGDIPVKVDGHGVLVKFPHDDALRRENPMVIANVPKGSFGIGFWIYLPMPKGLTFPYHVFSDAVAEGNKGIDRAKQMNDADFGGQMPFQTEQAGGVGVVFPRSASGRAKLTIATAAGPKEYTADRNGQIHVVLDDALTAENPKVTLSEKASWAGLDHLVVHP